MREAERATKRGGERAQREIEKPAWRETERGRRRGGKAVKRAGEERVWEEI